MNLDDLHKPTSAARIAQLIKKHYEITIPVGKMSVSSTKNMLESVQKNLNSIRNSKFGHTSEKNQNYNAFLLIEQCLKTQLQELTSRTYQKTQQAADLKGFWSQAGKGVADAGTAIGGALKSIPGASVTSPVSQAGIKDVIVGIKNLATAFSKNAKNEFAKILMKHGYNEATFMKHLDDFQTGKLSISDQEDIKSIISDIKWRARDIEGVDDDLIHNLEKTFKRLNIRLPNPTVKENNMRFTQFNAKKKIYESAMADAEVVLAAKDIADRFQDMVESLGKMVNEELPALTETIRDTMGAEQAEAFNSSAAQTINSALENIRSSKESLDSAARTLAGEEQPVEEPIASDGGLGEPGSEELDQIPASASGEEEEPLGRGKR